nr:polyprenyl synthetase family protein [Kibdelosporangium sp. MJ126-NF4]CEL13395.1 Octaprenyl diphosphate synthase / Dimethylallyltransferase / (2E,6E)-farnesyl diphosphate synthase / Geranylgeranyl pyrophosphate synthetase [Kibdelosporangium sp. MJ126-NF4]CTQ99084.1 Octaprenyl diphosphate synthase (EC 2.5.1.90) / Dimethylallyltransferase (EC 2.5.1.1) / (2E,6E)-farnesyl diphosphate synthase (EC 2.5.1.10) / Geranylgeranyl pyrophosphate synthetase (EC 2.5.1.29) [Kibdelosporangium sp. MJ126-NF4]
MTVHEVGASALNFLHTSRDLVDPVLRAAVDTMPPAIARMAGYQMGWWDEHGTPINARRGKSIRPALVYASAAAVGGTAGSVGAAAAAVELVHDFSLIHDDVMDADETRRHRPSLWTVFGVSPAILAGDALLNLAVRVLADSDHLAAPQAIRLLTHMVVDLLNGQSADLAFETRADIGLSECRRMAEEKTGALFGCSCALGALFGGGSAAQVAHLTTFGRRLGLAFQHIDDLLGIWGDPALTGKPVFSDLRNRKKSLPVVAAMSFGGSTGAELADLFARDEPLTEAELGRAADLVDRAGGRTWSQDQAEGLLTEALVELGQCAPLDDGLATLAELFVQRDR